MLTEHREIEIKTLERSDAAYCNMRIEMRICNLRNGNMLLISSIEICKSDLRTRIPAENSKSQKNSFPRNNKNPKISDFSILQFVVKRKGKERTLEIIKSRSKVIL